MTDISAIATMPREHLRGHIWVATNALPRDWQDGEVAALTKRARELNIAGKRFEQWMAGANL